MLYRSAFMYVSLMSDFHELGSDGIPIHLGDFATAHLVWAFGFAAIYHAYAGCCQTGPVRAKAPSGEGVRKRARVRHQDKR